MCRGSGQQEKHKKVIFAGSQNTPSSMDPDVAVESKDGCEDLYVCACLCACACVCVCVYVCVCVCVCVGKGHQRGSHTHLITARVFAFVLMHRLSCWLGRVWSIHDGQVLELPLLPLPLSTGWGGPLTLDGGTLLSGMGGERGRVMFP